jgi:hypothetical protein
MRKTDDVTHWAQRQFAAARLRDLRRVQRLVMMDALFARLDEARDQSALPEHPPNEHELRAWLLGVRRAKFDA